MTGAMMDCRQADQHLIDYLYDGLSVADKQAFEAHVLDCPAHEKEVARMKAVLALIRKQPKYELSGECSRKILLEAETKLKPNAGIFKFIWNPAAAVVLVAVVMLTVGVAVTIDLKPESQRKILEQEVLSEYRYEKPDRAITGGDYPSTEQAKEISDQAGLTDPLKTHKANKTQKTRQPNAGKDRSRRPRAKKTVSEPKSIERRKSGPVKKVTSAVREPEKGAAAAPSVDLTGYSAQSRPKAHRQLAKKKPQSPLREAPSSRLEQDVGNQAGGDGADMLAEEHKLEQDPAQRIAWYQRFLQKSPSDPRSVSIRYRLAKAYFLQNNCEKAVAAIREAVAGSPKHPLAGQALLDEASCLVRLNRFKEATVVYERLVKEYPEHRQEAQRGLRRIGS